MTFLIRGKKGHKINKSPTMRKNKTTTTISTYLIYMEIFGCLVWTAIKLYLFEILPEMLSDGNLWQ